MSSTGQARCKACDGAADLCNLCGGRALSATAGAASVRGARWAETVVRKLVARWPVMWPRSPKAVIIAHRWVADLSTRDDVRAKLARVCLEAAAVRYAQLVDVLARRRLELPPVEDETPE